MHTESKRILFLHTFPLDLKIYALHSIALLVVKFYFFE